MEEFQDNFGIFMNAMTVYDIASETYRMELKYARSDRRPRKMKLIDKNHDYFDKGSTFLPRRRVT